MSTKKHKREEINCTEEMYKETLKMCEDYSGAVKRIKGNRECLSNYISKRKSAPSDLEKVVYEQEIERLRAQIRSDEENTGYLHWALGHLDAREETVLTQLYIEGYAWDSILSETGETMSVGAIDKAKKRGIKKMAVLISDMKKQLSESSLSSEPTDGE